MLHTGILPHHTRWQRLFENLRYVVLDELHTYRGVFGSHLANVLRRLRRIARFYGSNPQFICSSATIANPGELAARLAETEFDVIEENGAPAGEKFFIFYNPPVVNRFLGIRRSYINEASRVAQEFLKRNSANHRVCQLAAAHRSAAHLSAAGESRAAGAAARDPRLSRRLSARRTARNRARLARRPHSRRGFDQRAGTGHRRRLARRHDHGRLSGHDCLHLAARRTRGTPQRKFLRRAGRFLRAARSVHRAASGLFFRPLARACLRSAGQSRNPGESPEMRGVRAAHRRERIFRRAWTFPNSATVWPKRAFCIAPASTGTGRRRPIRRMR